MTIFLFILILVALIVIHEFGHFIVAKLFSIRVDEFGIFFPPRIFALRKGETEYSLNWLPLGGFVKIYGENYDEGKDEPCSFISKNRWIQAAVLVAGVTGNILFAWVLLSTGYMVGLPTAVEHQGFGTVTNPQVTVVEVLPNSPAATAGLEPGDVIEQVQTGTTMASAGENASETQQFIAAHENESILLTVLRNGTEEHFLAMPVFGIVPGRKAIGVEFDDVGVLKLPLPLAFAQGGILGWNITTATASGLEQFFGQLFAGHANFSEVAGPIGITAFGAATIKQGYAATIVLVSLISINLALLNLIPIPGLDGGRLLIVAIEGVSRRQVPPQLVNTLTLIGLALLILFMIVISYHDILRQVG